MKNIAVFASGSGTNAKNISEYFFNHPSIRVSLICTNNANAKVLEKAESMGIETHIFSRDQFYKSNTVLDCLKDHSIDFIVLAGFLWLIPEFLVHSFPKKIINIHPALLPKYGGKGMYGHNVHLAVLENKETESGITIHYVDNEYDHGGTIFQATCPVYENDTPDSLADRIHHLEYEHFPKIIEKLCS